MMVKGTVTGLCAHDTMLVTVRVSSFALQRFAVKQDVCHTAASHTCLPTSPDHIIPSLLDLTSEMRLTNSIVL